MATKGRDQPAATRSPSQPPATVTRPGSAGLGQAPASISAQQSIPLSVVLIEQKLATQHAEIQKLLTENQRLAATHVALRQELTAAHVEGQRLQQLRSSMQAESEGKFLALLEKTANLEAELNGLEPLNAELQKLRGDAQELSSQKQELLEQIEKLSDEMRKNGSDNQKTSTLQQENEKLRQELHHARAAYEYEKKASLKQDEQKQAMEKTLVLLAKEVEKLHGELTSVRKAKASSTQGGAYITGVQAGEAGYSFPQSVQRDEYERHKEGALNVIGGNVNASESAISSELKHQQAMQNSSFSRLEQKQTEIWNTHIAPNGKIFYHNPMTGVTQWEKPAALEASESQSAAQTQGYQVPQGQVHAAAMHVQQPTLEMSQLRQLQMQQFGDVTGQQTVRALQVQEQLAHAEMYPHLPSQYMQPARPQMQDARGVQGHMNLATQMSQLIQGQLAYPAQVQQQTPYQMTPHAEYQLQSNTPAHLA